MRKLLIIIVLASVIVLLGWWKAGSRPTTPAGAVAQYVKALQAHDTKTLVRLTHDTEREIAEIKAKNPPALWPKVIDQYREAMLVGMDMNFDYKTLAFFPPNVWWNITKTREEMNEWQHVNYVYAAVYYSKLEDSPYIDGKLLQQT